jgi:CubicO group peptidase (beta-lactamase class C family)
VRGSGIYAAHGYRGQRIFVVPELEMVVVFTADLPGSEPSMLLSNFILPAVRSSEPLAENPEGVARLESRIEEAHGVGP